MSYWPAVTEHAGLTFCAANVAVRGGELDLIMRDGATGVRRSALPPQRRLRRRGRQRHLSQTTARLLHAAAVWLAGRGASFDTSSCRFDVLAITGSQLEWIPNAFNAD